MNEHRGSELYFITVNNDVYCCNAVTVEEEHPTPNRTQSGIGNTTTNIVKDTVSYTIQADIVATTPTQLTPPSQTCSCMLFFDDKTLILWSDYATSSMTGQYITQDEPTTMNYQLTLHDPDVLELPV